ncbi:(dimethylallyl)adenosine tRNA methylthiotransferase [Klebsiella grimontii]|uniref:(Dimethylallyl)adenosine tRNA methylthiotransferase n=1 Tax=Klebsiella grimontii TaxID=2058152 RepID=A0A7H4P7V0_9ENTR|nr:(dimethylallyl)adenosine tRNA methylthiotransferase [Klebsiella grimontii]
MREVNLLGQNVNAWRGENYDGTTGSFADLLRLVAAIDGIDRIRFTTSHPIEFTDDIIEVYRDTPELVSFLHLPVQSGSDRVLNLMAEPTRRWNIKRLSANCARRARIFRSAPTLSSASLAKPRRISSRP